MTPPNQPRTYKCPEKGCNFTCRQAYNMRYHKRKFHKPLKQAGNYTLKTQRIRQRCSNCGYYLTKSEEQEGEMCEQCNLDTRPI